MLFQMFICMVGGCAIDVDVRYVRLGHIRSKKSKDNNNIDDDNTV